MNDWRFETHPGESEAEFVFEVRRPRAARGAAVSRRPARRPLKKPVHPRPLRPLGRGKASVQFTFEPPRPKTPEPPSKTPGTSAPGSASPTPALEPAANGFDPGTVSRPCPQKAGTAKDRCSSPRPCPALPDLLCVTQVAGVPFHYVEAVGRNGATNLRKVTKRQEGRTQRLVPRALTALEKFVRNARAFGLPFDTVLTLGSLYCRCVKGSNPPALSNHSFGDAIDVAGVRWGAGGPASRAPETIVHNWDHPEQRVLLRRLNACLRLSFATVIDYHRADHQDHFHCDTNQGRGRITRGLATLRFVQEALGAVLGRQIAITGKLDEATRKALLDYSKQGPEIFKSDSQLNRIFDQLFREVAAGRASSSSQEIGEVSEVPSTNDFIDPRIDVHAQYSLMRMSKNPATAADAAGMLAAVKGGRLGGIYKEDQQVPALRAQRMGRGWWQIIPASEDAVLFLDPNAPATGAPLIVFRDRVRSDPARLDPALRKAWAVFAGLNTEVELCPAGGGLQTEIGGGVAPLANVVPPLLCRIERKTPPRPSCAVRILAPAPGQEFIIAANRPPAAPSMPTVRVQARALCNQREPAGAAITWEFRVSGTYPVRSGGGARQQAYRFLLGSATSTSGQALDVDLGQLSNLIVGGTLEVRATFRHPSGAQAAQTVRCRIRGGNPDRADVEALIGTEGQSGPCGDDAWALLRIFCHESAHRLRQFTGTGQVLVGPPAGIGIVQRDPEASEWVFPANRIAQPNNFFPRMFWNWQENVREGVRFFRNAKLPLARQDLRRLIANAARQRLVLPPPCLGVVYRAAIRRFNGGSEYGLQRIRPRAVRINGGTPTAVSAVYRVVPRRQNPGYVRNVLGDPHITTPIPAAFNHVTATQFPSPAELNAGAVTCTLCGVP